MTEEVIPFGRERASKYRLGKITNKYLIVNLYALAYQSREEAIYRMFKHDRSTRNLLIHQYRSSVKKELLWPLKSVRILAFYDYDR
jgi:hypothetical protein